MSNLDQQAFPMHERDDELRGMTLRDYFAAQCISALFQLQPGELPLEVVTMNAALVSYAVADQMMRVRKQEPAP